MAVLTISQILCLMITKFEKVFALAMVLDTILEEVLLPQLVMLSMVTSETYIPSSRVYGLKYLGKLPNT